MLALFSVNRVDADTTSSCSSSRRGRRLEDVTLVFGDLPEQYVITANRLALRLTPVLGRAEASGAPEGGPGPLGNRAGPG